MNALTIIVLLATVGYSFALLEKCSTEADCPQGQCCVFGKRCGPQLRVYSTCYLTAIHGCGCVSGSSCQVTFSYTVFGKTFSLRQCVRDGQSVTPQELNDTPEDQAERARRFLIRSCTVETVKEDCGKERCCLGGKYCSPLIPNYVPCNLKNSHKCPCADGLVCTLTKTLKIPVIGITLELKQCRPPGETVEIETVIMTEN